MSWDEQAKAMQKHGAKEAGIFSAQGDCWGKEGMSNVSKKEVEDLVNNIKTGKREMVINGKKCIVMNLVEGESITGKAKAEKEGEERPLFHCVLGKKNCVYMAGKAGSDERGVVATLEGPFAYLKEY